jgi:uncharacterized protein (TIGR03437 family)
MWSKRSKFEIFLKVAMTLVLWSMTPALEAQFQLSCTANSASAPLVRGEGIAELTADLLLTCTGGTATPSGVTVPTADIQIFLNTAITSRLLSGPNNEAMLLVDDPQPTAVAGVGPADAIAAQSPCPIGQICPMWGLGAGVGPNGLSSYDGLPHTFGGVTRTNRNVFFGQQVPGNSGAIVWLGIPVDSPVTRARVFRITNVRANASTLIVAGPHQPPTAIKATISISPPTALPIVNFSPQLTVGFAANSLLSSETAVTTFQQCTSVNSSGGALALASGGAGNAGAVTISEGFAQAFKVRNVSTWDGTTGTLGAAPAPQAVPGAVLPTATETGFYSPVAIDPVAGLADFGTRLKVVFNNVPAGAHVYVPVTLTTGSGTGLSSNLGLASAFASPVTDPMAAGYNGHLTLLLVTSESGSFAQATAGNFGMGLSEVSITAGSGQAVYEVVTEDPNNFESAVIPVTVAYVANPLAGTPAVGPVATATASFAPISNDFAAELNTVPAPRFVNNSTAAGNLFSITACATTTTISASPQTLTFSYIIGGAAPAPQNISAASLSPASGVSFTASTGAGCGWLTLLPASGITPANLTASVNPAGLAPNNYSCAITITAPAASSSPQVVHASLAVTQAATLSVSPPLLSFAYRVGSNATAPQFFSVASANPSVGVNFTITPGAGCDWMALNATTGTTPTVIVASLNSAVLVPGNYQCVLTVTAPGVTNGPQLEEASLTVSDRPALTASPRSLVFNYLSSGQQPQPQTIFIFAGGALVGFSATPATMSGGNWLSVGLSTGLTTPATFGVSVNPSGLAPGVYQGSITINSPSANPASQVVPVTLNVINPLALQNLEAQPEQFTFSFVAGAHQPQSRYLTITSPGAYHAKTDTAWLSVSPAEGTASASAPAVLSLHADPTSLSPGTYTGSVTVSTPTVGLLVGAFVTMTISESSQSIVLSRTGLSFRADAHGGAALTQAVSILKGGSDPLRWSLTPTTLSGGDWLSVSSTSGVAGDSPSLVNVHVAEAGLPPGDYFGDLRIDAPDAANSPQVVEVMLTVSAGAGIPPIVDPIGLLFTGAPSAVNPAAQTVTITNRSASTLSFESGTYFAGGAPWFTAQPSSGTLKGGETQQITIQPNTSGLLQGVLYHGELNLGFSDHSAQKVNVLLVAASGAPAATQQHATVICSPTGLVPLIISLGGEAYLSVGRPADVQVQVVDNCGSTLQGSGSMQLNLSNGDPAVELTPLPGSVWTGTVTLKNSAGDSVELSVGGEIGNQKTLPNTLLVSVGPDSTQPVLSPYGVSSVASFAPQAAIAPGSLINIYGHRLTGSSAQFSGFPLPMELAGTQVLIQGKALPLVSVSDSRIIAQVPYDVTFDAAAQLIVQRGWAQSAPETFAVAAAQPAVFTVNQQGSGQAVAMVGNSSNLADATHPVKAGDALVIYCAGLGAVTPPVPNGRAAPAAPLSQTGIPSVTIGHNPAHVLFSGLAPGFAGLYQVNVTVPAEVTPGDEVPVVIGIAGQTSPAVTISVR